MREIKILVFKLNGELFATDIMEVERILGYINPTKLPDAPEFLQGIIQYEQGVIPVISLHKKFMFKGEVADFDNQKIIVVKKDVGKFGVIVDDVYEVLTINESEIDNSNSIHSIISKKYIKGIIRKSEKLIILLDLNNILLEKEEEMIFKGVE